MAESPPWADVFEVLDGDGNRIAGQAIPLRQVTESTFELGARIRYLGETGLDPELDPYVRELPLDPDRRSDLASVPAALRWFERAHGVHTPAALFHDFVLRQHDAVRADQADLLFLHMLEALGVAPIRRNLMWAAVVARTRWSTSPITLVIWVLLSALGLGLFVLALIGVGLPSWLGGRLLVLVVSAVAPLPASVLWGRAWRAGLVAAVMAIWLLPAALIAVLALAIYELLEGAVGLVKS